VILEIYKGFPADEAGLKAGDEIVEVDGTPVGEFEGIVDELMRGARNTDVSVKYRRGGKTYDASLTRMGVTVDAVPYYGMVGDHTGYVVLRVFIRKASSQVSSAIQDLKNQGATQFVLDLRGNPGGLLSEAINLVNLFVPKNELVVFTRSRIKKFNRQYRTENDPLVPEVPLAVLINGRSASASEIVSGGLQDVDRAVVLGTRSFGKGLVQRQIPLEYNTSLKVTISRYYTSSGRCIQALDYSRRDEEGNAIRTREFNEFKTRNGRTVTDGGGITPDIAVGDAQVHPLVRRMEKEYTLFDFCNDYVNGGNPELDPSNPRQYDDRIWKAFTEFLRTSNFSMQTESEELVRDAMRKDSLFLTPGMEKAYSDLMARLEQDKDELLNQARNYLLGEIREELLLRQLYREGLYPVLLQDDPVVERAVGVLDNNREYRSILNQK
jgi:carboxyl-terminal processing protease